MQGIPKCASCGKVGDKEWHDMDANEKMQWIWVNRSDPCYCKSCYLKEQIDQVKYEKEREYYKEYKSQAYPKASEQGQPRLHRIESKEKWEGTRSFFASWKASSALHQLFQSYGLNINEGKTIPMDQVEGSSSKDNRLGQQHRKGTGQVVNTTGGKRGETEGSSIGTISETHQEFDLPMGSIGEEDVVEMESLDSSDFAALIGTDSILNKK